MAKRTDKEQKTSQPPADPGVDTHDVGPEPNPAEERERSTAVIEVMDGMPVVPAHGRLIPARGSGILGCKTSLDLRTPLGKATLINAGNPGDVDFDSQGFARLVAVDWIVFADTGVDPESGEVREFARTVLIDKDGRMFRTTSAHAPHRLAAMMDLFNRDEWSAGIPIVICERMSRKTKRTYHDFRVDTAAMPGVMEQQK